MWLTNTKLICRQQKNTHHNSVVREFTRIVEELNASKGYNQHIYEKNFISKDEKVMLQTNVKPGWHRRGRWHRSSRAAWAPEICRCADTHNTNRDGESCGGQIHGESSLWDCRLSDCQRLWGDKQLNSSTEKNGSTERNGSIEKNREAGEAVTGNGKYQTLALDSSAWVSKVSNRQ